MLRNVMVTWGPGQQTSLKNLPEPKDAITVPPKDRSESLETMDSVHKLLFERMFYRVTLHFCLKNSLKLLAISIGEKAPNNEFLQNYSQDKMAATFEVLRFKHEFLYQTFHRALSNGDRHHRNQRSPLATTDAKEMKNRLKVQPMDAISKLSEYALKNPTFNHRCVRMECDR
jgi:hypothetical protein